MLTGDGREATVIKALRMGIGDYLPKRGLKPDDLLTAITNVVEKKRQDAAADADHKRLLAASSVDLVTGVLGHTQLDERLAQLASLSPNTRAAYAIILVELDQFDDINEKFGLKAGDQALRAFTKALQQALRSGDIWGRFATNTFLAIANVNSDPRQLETLCKRVAEAATTRLDLDTVSLVLTGRVGGALCPQPTERDVVTPADMIGPAKAALMQAKAKQASFDIASMPPPTEPGQTSPGTTISSATTGIASPPAADQLRAVDRRREPRQRVFKRGQIVISGMNAAIDCTVRNMSVSGAGLRTNAPFAVPEEFELRIVGSGNDKRKVRVRWQVGVDLGVEYI